MVALGAPLAVLAPLVADAAVFVGLALASIIFLSTILLVVALSLRSRWEHMADDEEGRKRR
jgi:hypothetical protein